MKTQINTYDRTDSPADLKGFVIPARSGERMYASLFTPRGRGPRPTILLLHGYPGDENNYDLAHAFQRAGYTVVVFHYRGTWGSEGLFSVTHLLEDVSSALAFIREHTGEETYRFDAQRLILIGHSMGGFAALQTAARDTRLLGAAAVAAFDLSLAAQKPNLYAAVRREFADCVPIRRVELDSLMNEIDENAEKWSFPALARRLSGMPVCLVGASEDEISPPRHHMGPLCRALRQIPGARVTARLLNDGHCLSDTRVELEGILTQWVEGLLDPETEA